MKISKNNIMMRTCVSWGGKYPEDLCSLVRNTFLCCVFGLFIGALGGVLLTAILHPLATLIHSYVTGTEWLVKGVAWNGVPLAIGAIALLVVSVVSLCVLGGKVYKTGTEAIHTSTPKILKEWVKSKHDKVCLKVEVADND